MSPAATTMDAQVVKENAASIKVLDDLMQKLSLSKEAAAVKESSTAIATFINGHIEDLDTPTR